MEVREDLHHLIRTDSMATTQTEGLVGANFVNIAPGTDQAAIVPENGTIPARDPFQMADLLQQASDTITLVNDTVESLRGDITKAVEQVALTAEDAHELLEDIRPDITNITRNANRISDDTQQVIARIRAGEGTIGKLVNDDTLYRRATEIATEAKSVMAEVKSVVENVKGVSNEARGAIADFRAKDGPAQGLMADMRVTLSQAREATADLADNMEAMKYNFLLRGFFNRRGYYDLDAISPDEYRKGVLENGKRKAMRIWLGDAVLFQPGPDGAPILTEDGRARVDSAMATYLKYLPSSPIVVEGYATDGTVDERFSRSGSGRESCAATCSAGYELPPQTVGAIALGHEAPGSPEGDTWNGVALTLFLDRTELQLVNQGAPRIPVANAATPAVNAGDQVSGVAPVLDSVSLGQERRTCERTVSIANGHPDRRDCGLRRNLPLLYR